MPCRHAGRAFQWRRAVALGRAGEGPLLSALDACAFPPQADRGPCLPCRPFSLAPQLLMSKTLGGSVANQSKALIALSSVVKSFVDDLVAAGERGRACNRTLL